MEHNENLSTDSAATMPDFYRYLLAIRPDPGLYPLFQQIAISAGQTAYLELLHLTLCVIGQPEERDRFIVGRVRKAFRDQVFRSVPVNLSRVHLGRQGAFARTRGRQDEIQEFYRRLVRLLAVCGIEPLHRKSGLHPHVTLGHAACGPGRMAISLPWFPAELLLIESEVGLTRHNVLARWPLLPPRQPLLPFGDSFETAASFAA